MWESATEICAIQVHFVLCLGDIYIFTPRTKYFNPAVPEFITDADRYNTLSLTIDARTGAEPAVFLLFLHFSQAFRSKYVPGVNESVQIGCILVHLDKLLVGQVVLVDWGCLGDHFHTLILKFHFVPEPLKVESIFNKF